MSGVRVQVSAGRLAQSRQVDENVRKGFRVRGSGRNVLSVSFLSSLNPDPLNPDCSDQGGAAKLETGNLKLAGVSVDRLAEIVAPENGNLEEASPVSRFEFPVSDWLTPASGL